MYSHLPPALVRLAVLVCLAFASVSSAQPAAQQVENLRVWHSPQGTRIVFDVSADVRHSMFELEGPRRLVVDIENADLTIALPTLSPDNPHIEAIRSGSPQPGVLRFVFELRKPLQSTSFVLSPNELYGHRLVVDISEKERVLVPELLDLVDASAAESSTSTSPTNQTTEQATEQTDNTPPAALSKRQLVVAIDAGHGGEDPGAIGYRGSREKELTLQIAKRLKQRIDKDPRMRAELIRASDYYIELHKRRLAARAMGADLFLSIHADAFSKKSASGFSVFALSQSGATSAMARALAAKENASDLIGGVSLADKDQVLAQVLVDLSMTNTISESVNLGGRVLKELAKLGKLHSKRVEQAGFAVLKSPDMPSILIETGFITNPSEERNLRSSRFQKKLADAIYQAIDGYYQQTPHYTVASYTTPSVGASSARNSASRKSSSPQVHVVKRGDSLSKISAQYNVTIRSIKRINKLKRDTVFVGQKIKLPGGAQAASRKVVKHKVRRGDTLSEIAQRYGSTMSKIMAANKLRGRTIMLGQVLTIPQ